jgi:proteasome accessory factor C
MVPYLLQRQGIALDEAAAHFSISTDQLVEDLELLFVCGRPGHLPDDLIEAEWESGRVYLDNADDIAAPLRLGLDEAVALLAGLRTLADADGATDTSALATALAKLGAATGALADAAGAVSITLDDETDPDLLARLRAAVTSHRRVHLSYLVPGRDEATERDVDPMRVVTIAGHWYLEGWCHRAEAVRLFRLTRVLEALVLDIDGTPPEQAVGRDLDRLFDPSNADLVVVLELTPRCRWVADFYHAESRDDHEDGSMTVRVRAADTGWLRQLALRTGGGVRVLAPVEVAEQVAAQADAALARYRS